MERSSTDPSMLVVTYTSDHNHPCPTNPHKSNSKSLITTNNVVAETTPESVSDYTKDLGEEIHPNNLFSSILNTSGTLVNDSQLEVTSSPLESFINQDYDLERDSDILSRVLMSTQHGEDDHVFDDLEELPEISAIFNKGLCSAKDRVLVIVNDGDINYDEDGRLYEPCGFLCAPSTMIMS